MGDLKDLVDSSSRFGAAKMGAETTRNSPLVIVLVEGPSDKKIYKRLIKFADVQSTGGWENLIEIKRRMEKDPFQPVLGIIDADFRRIFPHKFADLPADVFKTDSHDLEMDLIRSEALENVLSEYDIDETKTETKREAFEKREKSSIRMILLREASKMGVVRLHNLGNDWNLSFRQKGGTEYLDFRFVDQKSVSLNLDELLKELENKNIEHNFFKRDFRYESIIAEISKGNDPWQLCNGHDAMCILAVATEIAISNKGRAHFAERVKFLESQLRSAYYPAHFAQTQLYRDLKAWPVPAGFKLEILP